MIEQFYTCPYCFENISALVDPSVSHQEYIEDCEVCCNPITIIVTCQDFQLNSFDSIIIGQ